MQFSSVRAYTALCVCGPGVADAKGYPGTSNEESCVGATRRSPVGRSLASHGPGSEVADISPKHFSPAERHASVVAAPNKHLEAVRVKGKPTLAEEGIQ